MRPATISAALLSAASAILFLGCGSGPGPGAASPIQLHGGDVIGRAAFAVGDTAQGGQGQTVDGIPSGLEVVTYHVHPHLALYVNGSQVAIPAGIGIVNPSPSVNGFIVGGQSLYWLHTHDASGIIHVEAPVAQPFTLKEFFDIWGQPLTSSNVAGFAGAQTITVNGAAFTADPATIQLAAGVQIVIQVGTPVVSDPGYILPAGY